MLILVALLLFGAWASIVGSNRGGNAFGWFCAGFFGGLIGVAFAYTVGKRCSACKRKIHRYAVLCPYCQTRQADLPAIDSNSVQAQMNAEERRLCEFNRVAATALCLKRLKREREEAAAKR